MSHRLLFSMLMCAVLSTVLWARSAVAGPLVAVGTAEQAKAALLAAAPGQTIEFADGEYDLGRMSVSVEASEDNPLIIRAKNTGKARFIGKTDFTFRRSAHVTLQGFYFASDDGTVVQIAGSHHVRISRNHFQLNQPPGATRTSAITDARGTGDDRRPHWVEISSIAEGPVHSHHNRIDHNRFQDKHTVGCFVSIVGYRGEPFQVSQHDRIDHNHFAWIGPRIPNGMEAVRAGLSYLSLSDGFTIIEQNLFENCDGDPEIVSIKQCSAVVRGNTFIASQGGVCLRHGNRNEVYGNFFFGNGKRGTSGVRPYGDDNRIYNNYFEGLTGPALQLTGGNIDYGSGETEDRDLLKKHFRPRRLFVAFNTVVNCDVPATIGSKGNWHLPIQGLTLANNLFVGGGRKVIDVVSEPEGSTWTGNIVSPAPGAQVGVERPQDRVRIAEVKLSQAGGIYRPATEKSTIVDAAAGTFSDIAVDIDGQPRSGKYDVGADEASSAPVKYRPLTAADVGPGAMDED